MLQSIEINDAEQSILWAETTELSPSEVAQIRTRSDLADLKKKLESTSPNGELLKALKAEVSTTPAFAEKPTEQIAVTPPAIPPEVQNVINLSEGQSYFYLMSRIIALGYIPSIDWVKNFKNDAKGAKVALKWAAIHTTPLYFTKFDPESKVMNGSLHKQFRGFMNDKTTVAGLDDERRALKEAVAKFANIPGKVELLQELRTRNDILDQIDSLRTAGDTTKVTELFRQYPGTARTTWTDIIKMIGHVLVDVVTPGKPKVVKAINVVSRLKDFTDKAYIKEETGDFRAENTKALNDVHAIDKKFADKIATLQSDRIAYEADPKNENLLKKFQKSLAAYDKDAKPLEKLWLTTLAGLSPADLQKAIKTSNWANSIATANAEHFKPVQGGIDFVSKHKVASGVYKGFMGVGMLSLLYNGVNSKNPWEKSMWDMAKAGEWGNLAKQSGWRVVDTAVGFVPILGWVHEAAMLNKIPGFNTSKYAEFLLGWKMDDDEKKFREMFLLTWFLGAGWKVVKYGAKGFVEAAQVAWLASKAYKAGWLAVKTSNFIRGGVMMAWLGMSMVSVVHDLGDEKDIPYVPFI